MNEEERINGINEIINKSNNSMKNNIEWETLFDNIPIENNIPKEDNPMREFLVSKHINERYYKANHFKSLGHWMNYWNQVFDKGNIKLTNSIGDSLVKIYQKSINNFNGVLHADFSYEYHRTPQYINDENLNDYINNVKIKYKI